MECDTGSPISAISEKLYFKGFNKISLNSSDLDFKSY